jgi:hypothetical protein
MNVPYVSGRSLRLLPPSWGDPANITPSGRSERFPPPTGPRRLRTASVAYAFRPLLAEYCAFLEASGTPRRCAASSSTRTASTDLPSDRRHRCVLGSRRRPSSTGAWISAQALRPQYRSSS